MVTLFAPELSSPLCSFRLSLKSAQHSGLPLSSRGGALYPKSSPCSPCLFWIFLYPRFPFLSQGSALHQRPVPCSSSSDALHPGLILPYGNDTIDPNLLPYRPCLSWGTALKSGQPFNISCPRLRLGGAPVSGAAARRSPSPSRAPCQNNPYTPRLTLAHDQLRASLIVPTPMSRLTPSSRWTKGTRREISPA